MKYPINHTLKKTLFDFILSCCVVSTRRVDAAAAASATDRWASISHMYVWGHTIMSLSQARTGPGVSCQSRHTIMSLNQSPTGPGVSCQSQGWVWHKISTKPRFIRCRIVSCLCLYSRLTVREAGISHIYENIQSCHENIQSCHENIQSCHEDIQSCHSIKHPQGSSVNL